MSRRQPEREYRTLVCPVCLLSFSVKNTKTGICRGCLGEEWVKYLPTPDEIDAAKRAIREGRDLDGSTCRARVSVELEGKEDDRDSLRPPKTHKMFIPVGKGRLHSL